mmetsp:Transcript_17761/g.41193  ORF Transcript_17761/g.41193 Transcript_17761/m.41193 type:complete len:963 (+) Transcript_17761:57-2945(+)
MIPMKFGMGRFGSHDENHVSLEKLAESLDMMNASLHDQLIEMRKGQQAIVTALEKMLPVGGSRDGTLEDRNMDDRASVLSGEGSMTGSFEKLDKAVVFAPDFSQLSRASLDSRSEKLQREDSSPRRTSPGGGNGHHRRSHSSTQSHREHTSSCEFHSGRDREAGAEAMVSSERSLGCDSQMLAPQLPARWPQSLKPRPGFGTKDMSSSVTAEPRSAMVMKVTTQELDGLEVASVSTKRKLTGLDPNSPTRLVFDAIGLFVLTYDLTVTPYVLAWNRSITGASWFLAALTAIYWSLDLFLNFFTGFYAGGELEIDLKKVVWKYFHTWFLPDLTIVTFEWLSLCLPNGTRLRIILLLRITRLMKTVRSILDRAQVVWVRVVLQYIMLFFAVLWLTHLLCCSWFTVGRNAWSDTGMHWVETFDENFDSPGPEFEYLSAYHWALQTLAAGTMDISPRSSVERQFNILSLIFGWLFGNMVVSSFVLVMTEIQLAQKERSDKLMMLDRYMKQHHIDQAMRVRVQKQVLQKMGVEKRLDAEDVEALKHLSEALRLALKVEIYKPHLMRYPLFRVWHQLDTHSLNLLINRDLVALKALEDGRTLFEASEEAEFAFLIISGSTTYHLELIAGSSAEDPQQDDGEEVGQGHLVAEAALWCEWIHVGALYTATHSEVLTISAKDFFRVALGHKSLRDLSQEYGQIFVHKLFKACPPHSTYPTDLRVPFGEYNEIITSMDFKHRKLVGEAALESLRETTWKRQLFMGDGKGLAALEAEVRKGGCVLIQNAVGEVERVVAVTVLLMAREDGSIFLQMGKWQKGHAVPDCKLPGVKQEHGETIHDSFHRLLREELEPIAGGVHLTALKRETDLKPSLSFGINTKYLRTVHLATFNEEYHIPFSGDDCFYIPRNDLYVIRSARGVKILYGWVRPENKESALEGGKELERRLAGLDSSESHEGQEVYWPLLHYDEVEV